MTTNPDALIWPEDVKAERTTDERMSQLAESFPTLYGRPGTRPWHPDALIKDFGKQCSGTQHASRFVLSVYNTSIARQSKRLAFSLVDAYATWDDEHRAALVAWARAPWFA